MSPDSWQPQPFVWERRDDALTERERRIYASSTKLVHITRVVK